MSNPCQNIPLDDIIAFIVSNKSYLSNKHKQTLLQEIKATNAAEVDLLEEVSSQIALIRAMRKKIFAGGVVTDIKEAKEVVQSSTSLLNLLTKLYEDVHNIGRLRKIEQCTLNVLKDLDPELQTLFLTRLEAALEG